MHLPLPMRLFSLTRFKQSHIPIPRLLPMFLDRCPFIKGCSHADSDYQQFQAKLVPNINANLVLGVRTPALRRYAKQLFKNTPEKAQAFIQQLPHTYYEENNVHGELIGHLAKTPEEAFELLDRFLPYVDNWATCDLMRIPAFKKDLTTTLTKIKEWIFSEPEYMVRFGIVQLMTLFLDDAFDL